MSMEQFRMYDNNIFAFLLLAILLFVVVVKKDIYDQSRKLFYRMIIVNMVLLIVEILAWAFDGIDTQSAFFFNYLFNYALILMEPIMASMWLSYVDYKINGSITRLRRRIYYLHASIFALVLLIINIFEPIAFTIDDNNIYHRGSYLWLSLVFVFMLVLYTIFLAIKNRKKLSDNMIRFIAIFALLPVTVSFVQLFVYGLIMTWAVVALGIVLAYYIIEISGNSKDFLTDLHSRRKIEEIVRGKIEQQKTFSAVLIDLEYFKEINDKYGHKSGDNMLVHFSKILFIAFGKNNYVSRIGGDEFLIVCDETDINIVYGFKETIKEMIDSYTELDIIKEIGFSFGGHVFEYEEGINYDEILNVVDKKMYENKSINKNLKRRKSDLL